MSNLVSLFTQAFRQIRSRKGLWCAVVLTLALGIGANTAVFSVVNRMLVQPLPFPDANQLVMVYNTYPKNDLLFAGTSIPDYLDRKEGAPSFASLAMLTQDYMSLTLSDTPERVLASRTTPSLFTVLKSPAALGRTLIDADAEEGATPVVVLSHGFWQRAYAADVSVIGKQLQLSGRSYRIVGVMPEGFAFPDMSRELYVPMVFSAREKSDAERGNEYSISIGRLKPGASIESANAEMKVLVDRLTARSPEAKVFYDSAGFGGRAEYLQSFFVGELSGMLGLLQAATLLVLLIATANVANLLLAQGLARRREFSVRAAIGAGSMQLFRQLSAEALIAAMASAVLGILVAKACLMLMGEQLTQRMGGSLLAPTLDAPVLLFTLLLAIVVAMLVALIPAMIVQHSLTQGLRDGGHGSTTGKLTQFSRSSLVVMQLTLSVALLIGAGLLLRSFERLSAVDPGFKAKGLYSASVSLSAQLYPEAVQRTNFYSAALRGVRALPGVTHAGVVVGLPFTSMAFAGASFRIKGEIYDASRSPPHAFQRVIDEGYLEAAQVPLLMGRNFTPADRADTAPVVLIDKIFADKHFPEKNPIGQLVTRGDSRDPNTAWSTVVGVVGAVKSSDLSTDVRKETMYAPLQQSPDALASFVIRSNLDVAALSQSVRQVLQKLDPGLPLFDIQSMQSRISDSLGPKRAPMQLLAVFAGIALLLAAVGMYAVLAFLVGQRRGEIGLRVAIGAMRGDIIRMILGHSAKLIGIGLVLGLAGALLLARGLSAQLFGVSPYDPSTYLIVLAMLATVGIIASVLPAQRACAVDPLRALRGE
jgi:predicted permease